MNIECQGRKCHMFSIPINLIFLNLYVSFWIYPRTYHFHLQTSLIFFVFFSNIVRLFVWVFFINNANLSLEYNRHHFYTYFDREYSSTPSRNIWCRYLKTRHLFKRYLIDWLKTIYIDRTLQDNVVSVCLWC